MEYYKYMNSMLISKKWQQEQLFQVKWACLDMLPTLQQLDQDAAGKLCADSTGDGQANKGRLSREGSYSHFFPVCRKAENWYSLW